MFRPCAAWPRANSFRANQYAVAAGRPPRLPCSSPRRGMALLFGIIARSRGMAAGDDRHLAEPTAQGPEALLAITRERWSRMALAAGAGGAELPKAMTAQSQSSAGRIDLMGPGTMMDTSAS